MMKMWIPLLVFVLTLTLKYNYQSVQLQFTKKSNSCWSYQKMHSGTFSGWVHFYWWINVTENNPVFLGYCKNRFIIWILKLRSPKTSRSDAHVPHCAHAFWIWTHRHWNLLSAVSKLILKHYRWNYKAVGCWKHYCQNITVCKLCIIDFNFQLLFTLCSFHSMMSVSHVPSPCLRFVGDILYLLVLFQGCRGRFCTSDKIQIWRNWGKWCVSTFECYITKYTLLWNDN